MTHYHYIEDDGELVDLIPFCSDSCHREHMSLAYDGWNGCHEGGDSAEFCAHCGAFAGGSAECDCQLQNVVIHRLPSEEGERCEHGNWLQLPARMLETNL